MLFLCTARLISLVYFTELPSAGRPPRRRGRQGREASLGLSRVAHCLGPPSQSRGGEEEERGKKEREMGEASETQSAAIAWCQTDTVIGGAPIIRLLLRTSTPL